MATIKTVFQLQDQMTKPLQNIAKANNILINTMEEMGRKMDSAFDTSALDAARESIAQATAAFDQMGQEVEEAAKAEERLKNNIEDATGAAKGLESALGGVLATLGSIATIKMGMDWAKDNMALADTQRNAENQLAAVLANMGNTQADYKAILNKASEIQSKGIYGDEAMIAGAGELATYFTDAEAIMSMMDTLSNYAMGMSGGGAVDPTAMVNYATGIGKIMTGSYDAMTKKGFEFTDAQKAVIEGTATQAQYVEALGADYESMSADMRAATVINDIIAESWDGLYATMSNTPEGQIIQFNNKLGDLRETLGNRIYPAVLMVYDAFGNNFPQVEAILTALTDALGVIFMVIGAIAEAAVTVGGAIVDNWGWIGPIVYGIAGALAVYYGQLLLVKAAELASAAAAGAVAVAKGLMAAATTVLTGATWAEATAQLSLNAAMYACPLVWIIMLVIALIAVFYAVIGAINKFAGTSISATGVIAGAFAALGAFLWNLVLGALELVFGAIESLVNPFIQFANFLGNLFTNPISSIIYLFQGMADTVLGILQKIASALDFVFGSNMAGTIQNWRDGLKDAADALVAEYAPNENYQQIMNNLDLSVGDLGLNRIAYSDAWAAGYEFGEGIEDTVGGLFDFEGMGADIPGMDGYNWGNSLDGIYNNTGDTAANTAACADALNVTEEDLKYLKDIAEREAINRFTTAEITVEQHNENHIEKDVDVDGIMDALAADFAEKLDISGEGVE